MPRFATIMFQLLALSLLVAPSSSFGIESQLRAVPQQQQQHCVHCTYSYNYKYSSEKRSNQRMRVVASTSKDSEVPSAVAAEQLSNSSSRVYQLLSTPRDNKPGRSNFFYNDEVISHLHGYVFLVGSIVAHDPIFFFSFLALASAAAGATLAGLLPANPRIPAIVAVLTLAITVSSRYYVHLAGFEHAPVLHYFVEDLRYTIEPDDSSLLWETIICALNVAWGIWGSWKTKEQINGATVGF